MTQSLTQHPKLAAPKRVVSKLTVLLAVCVSLALIAAACGGDESSDDATTTTTGSAATGSPDAGTPPVTNGFDGETIKLGYLTAETSTLAIVGIPLAEGSQVYWDWVNSQGGIAGKYKVELETADTADTPATAVSEYQRLKDDVVMFAQVLSTPPTQAVLEFLREDNIIAVPGSLSGSWAGERWLLPNGAAYEYEMINLADWFVTESGLATANDVHCAIYIDDKFGNDTVKGVEHAMEQLGLELAETQTLARGDTSFAPQLAAFEAANCTVVYAMTVPTEQNAMLADAKALGFEPYWLGALPSFLNIYGGIAPENYEKFYVALDLLALEPEITDETRSERPGMANFLERFAASEVGGMPNTFHLTGYFQSFVVEALLEKAVELGDLSRAGLEAAQAQLGTVEMDGLVAEKYTYGPPEDRVPTSATRIFKFDASAAPNYLTEVTQFDSDHNTTFDLY